MLVFCTTPQRAARYAFASIASAALMVGFAAAYDEKTEKYCGDDYLAYCSKHPAESAEARYCMEAHRDQLSKQCVKALVEAGLVPRKYLTKKVVDND